MTGRAVVLTELAARMRADSDRWFPVLVEETPRWSFYAMGLVGEAGEVANVAKKALRGTHDLTGLGEELADVFTYLCLLADECGIDLLDAYTAKRAVCEERWGQTKAGEP